MVSEPESASAASPSPPAPPRPPRPAQPTAWPQQPPERPSGPGAGLRSDPGSGPSSGPRSGSGQSPDPTPGSSSGSGSLLLWALAAVLCGAAALAAVLVFDHTQNRVVPAISVAALCAAVVLLAGFLYRFERRVARLEHATGPALENEIGRAHV